MAADYAAVQRPVELSADALLVAKRGVDGVYDSDPKTHPDAKRYAHHTYRQAVDRRVNVMDTSAFLLAEEQNLVMQSSTLSERASGPVAAWTASACPAHGKEVDQPGTGTPAVRAGPMSASVDSGIFGARRLP
ncbi:hypothetical protein [Streptomyces sp. NPDC058755]|uniref:amino acid kinase family protein n=1 Tax=Streptomyces sp. NPDC058755 TaxID=3346624 RepID=UPI0036A768B4